MTYPGQSAERTAIGWGRTALAAAGLGALLLRLGLERSSVLEILSAIIALLAAAGFAWRGRAAYRNSTVSTPVLRWLTVAIAAVGILAALGALN
ncbi:MAG TPA: DUF202 domain-containing protein [Jatrophihabitantaceae bacterium]|jgi:hypothetical protein|nr:DUF202 domain-containing protein [Jatrophihabitantaceae bacterium]